MFTIGFNLDGANKSVAKMKLFVEFTHAIIKIFNLKY